MPAEQRTSVIFCLSKGYKSAVTKNRGTTIVSAFGKIYARVLNKRLLSRLEPILRQGPRELSLIRNCMDHVFG